MIYAYVAVVYVTYFQIYYHCLLDRVLPKDLWRENFVHYDFLSHILYFDTVYLYALHKHICIYHATAKYNTLPLDNRETPSKLFLSFASFSYIS